ncbi:MAG TPA: tripartite tricarboxylate transporter substrate binding protein [Xanthobacteraceae bacterium]|jgi:tripartite-type tricarboxylate transporter receptor subunit TctC
MRSFLVKLACALALAVAAPAAALAQQAWPQKPIKMIVPFAPGGGNDYIGRLIAKHLSQRLGQQVYVENRSGANGIIGLQALMQADPDGYTIATTSDGPIVINPALYEGRLPYDSLRDFAPVALMVKYPVLLVAHPSVPAKTVPELIALAKQKPGTLAYSSGGPGNYGHLAGELLSSITGAKFLHVPYKGTGPATLALVAGDVQLMFSNVATVLEHVRAGQMVALGVGEQKPLESLPEIPAIADTVAGFETSTWVGIIAPAKTPPDVVARLSKEINAILQDKDLLEVLAAQKVIPTPAGPDEFLAKIKQELGKWGPIVKAAGIKAE